MLTIYGTIAASPQIQVPINLYDVFANFLPGSLLIIGIIAPIVGANNLVQLGLGSALIFFIISYALGFVIQAFGGWMSSGDAAFENHMKNIREGNGNGEPQDDADGNGEPQDDTEELVQEESEVNEIAQRNPEVNRRDVNYGSIDVTFDELVSQAKHVSSRYEDWEGLYNWVMVRLDNSSRTRALRMHSTFLAVRGLAVVFSFFVLYYLTMAVLIYCFGLSVSAGLEVILVIAAACILFAAVLYRRQIGLCDNFVNIMIREYVGEFEITD